MSRSLSIAYLTIFSYFANIFPRTISEGSILFIMTL